MKSYIELLTEAELIEKMKKSVAVGHIDLDFDEGDKIVGDPRPYSELVAFAGRSAMNMRVDQKAPQGRVKAEGRATKQQMQPVEQATAVKNNAAMGGMQQGSRLAGAALDELQDIAKKSGAAVHRYEKIIKFKVERKKLVLPNLSLPDQISELEGIIESLKNNYFDKYQMDVAVAELHGLSDATEEESRSKAGLDPLQTELVGLRNRRLSEAIALLPK